MLALQDLGRLPDRFDALLCVDALEYVAPEDWPGVVAGLAGVLLPGAPAYVTVELPGEPLPPPSDPRQVPGEVINEAGGYHYYPPRDSVRGWLAAAGFATADEADADYYWHLMLTRENHVPLGEINFIIPNGPWLTARDPVSPSSPCPRRAGTRARGAGYSAWMPCGSGR